MSFSVRWKKRRETKEYGVGTFLSSIVTVRWIGSNPLKVYNFSRGKFMVELVTANFRCYQIETFMQVNRDKRYCTLFFLKIWHSWLIPIKLLRQVAESVWLHCNHCHLRIKKHCKWAQNVNLTVIKNLQIARKILECLSYMKSYQNYTMEYSKSCSFVPIKWSCERGHLSKETPLNIRDYSYLNGLF